MKMKLSEIRKLVREQLVISLLEFQTKDMPSGTSWKVANRGWAAKNMNGVVNYWYGDDETKNKKSATDFSHDSTKQKEASGME